MSALKDQIMNDISILENKSDLKNLLVYLNFLKEKEEWEETLEILKDKKQMRRIRQSLRDIKNGDVVDIDCRGNIY